MLTKQETLLARDAWAESSKGNQEDCYDIWLTTSGFMMVGFVSRLSLANHSDLRFFLVVLALLRQDGIH